MALAIGSLSVDAFRGTIQSKQKGVEYFTRPGVAGLGLLVDAVHSTPSTIETDFTGTLAECNTWRNTALGFVGTSQSVTDAFGTTWTDVAILGFEFVYRTAKGLGGSKTHIVTARWTMAAEA